MISASPETRQLQRAGRLGAVANCVVSVLIACCSLLAALFLAASAGSYSALFHALGVQLPAPTRFLVAGHPWLMPCFLTALAIAVLLKEVFLPDVRDRLRAALVSFLVLGFCVVLSVVALNLPVLLMLQKLSSAK